MALQYVVLSKLLYIAFSFIVSLILLNILIAIMSNSFTQIQVIINFKTILFGRKTTTKNGDLNLHKLLWR
jgi:hypothetical protein